MTEPNLSMVAGCSRLFDSLSHTIGGSNGAYHYLRRLRGNKVKRVELQLLLLTPFPARVESLVVL